MRLGLPGLPPVHALLALPRRTILRHIPAAVEGVDERLEEALVLGLVVVLLQQRLDGLRRLLRVVERNAREQVVHHVVVDDLVHEVAADEAEAAVNRAESAARERPLLGGEVGHGRVRVVEVGDGHCFCQYLHDCERKKEDIPSQWCTQKYGIT